jgi:inosose dehydratase
VDTGHLVLALTDPVAFVMKWAEKVSWMHCKDVKTADIAALERPGVRWQDHFTPLGTGVVDFPKVLQSLDDVGYESWLVVEQDNSPDPYQTSKISIAYLRRVLTALEQPQVRSRNARTTARECLSNPFGNSNDDSKD